MNAAAILAEMDILEEEEIEDDQRRVFAENRRRNQLIRELSSPFDTLSDAKFAKKFRIPKALARWLCNEIALHLPNEGVTCEIPKNNQILSTLRFYATGSFQENIGDASYASFSQTTVSRVIGNVTEAILTLDEEWIEFPFAPEELQQISEAFQEHIGFPGVIGAIDCTHVALRGPIDQKWNYLNHNRYYSMNVQVTCDNRSRITSIDGYPGATHDARIWSNSEVREIMNGYINQEGRHYYIIGDSGYPLEPCILTPFLNAEDNTPEAAYNERFTHTRSIIERVFGMLKGKWKCLHKSRTLLYDPLKVILFFRACAILHNLLIAYREENADYESEDDSEDENDFNDDMPEDENHFDADDVNNVGGNVLRRGQLIRGNIIQQYFANN